jgi:5-methylcytosine-specific restriction endonuclease McrA
MLRVLLCSLLRSLLCRSLLGLAAITALHSLIFFPSQVLAYPPYYRAHVRDSSASPASFHIQRNVERLLIGKHKFGVQFIWDRYGSAVIQRDGTTLSISGAQYSNDSTEYCKVNGTIAVVDDKKLLFTGTLQLYTKNCCGVIERTGTFTFAKRGARKFWRLQEFNKLCDQYTCAYYLDLFE